MEQTGRRPVVIWQSDDLIRILQSVVVIPLTTNVDRSRIFGTSGSASSHCASSSKLRSRQGPGLAIE
jgi:mRNA-degrading endonuclease toxin of MazEF toxin-antitoxin module